MFVLFFSFLLWLCVCDIFSFLLLHNKLPQIQWLKTILTYVTALLVRSPSTRYLGSLKILTVVKLGCQPNCVFILSLGSSRLTWLQQNSVAFSCETVVSIDISLPAISQGLLSANRDHLHCLTRDLHFESWNRKISPANSCHTYFLQKSPNTQFSKNFMFKIKI